MMSLCPWPQPSRPGMLFDSPCDFLHAFLGFAVAVAPREIGALGALSFIVYEFYRAKPAESKIAAGVQFAAGALAAEAVGVGGWR